MKSGSCVFLGTFAAMAVSWCAMIFFPTLQMGGQQAVAIDASTGDYYPPLRPGLALQGKDIYQANGCNYCHSQQVFAQQAVKGMSNWVGADIQRGWGKRWSVAQDYVNDTPVLIGNRRIGPDLANIGIRRDDDTNHVNFAWHLTHLYNPQIHSPGSIMPPYPYLFTKQKIQGSPSPDALKLTGEFAPPSGYEIVPRPAAIALTHYLFSLQQGVALFEAPLPYIPKPTNAPAGGTNTVKVGATNAVNAQVK